MTSAKMLGTYGETLAQQYLKQHGYQIVSRNCRFGRLEIDLITKKDGYFIFFEIKTRRFFNQRPKDTPITKKQISNLKQGIISYCIKNRINLDAAYLDLLIVYIGQTSESVAFRHYADIF